MELRRLVPAAFEKQVCLLFQMFCSLGCDVKWSLRMCGVVWCCYGNKRCVANVSVAYLISVGFVMSEILLAPYPLL